MHNYLTPSANLVHVCQLRDGLRHRPGPINAKEFNDVAREHVGKHIEVRLKKEAAEVIAYR